MDSRNASVPEIRADDFARRFSLRAPNLMWFLGSGASAAAGIPTAFDMVWEFKQQLFISQRRVSPQVVADLASSTIRAQLQAHIDSLSTLPRAGSADEYARLFEAVYPAEADRRAYLEAKIAGAKPSFGHMALATLMRARRALIVWTTNFDPLIADACAKVYDGTGALTTAALDAPELALERINESRWPLEIKLHGDFRSRRLKNTNDELRLQDARMRRLLIDCCRRYGLVVVGYSGRDDSIMDTLEEALQQPGAFPNGLFWLHRGGDMPFERVAGLLSRAKAAGAAAALVRIQNFDETLRDLVRLIEELDTKSLDSFAASRSRRGGAPAPTGRVGWPVVRLNALEVARVPTVCRRVVCQIGGTREAREAVKQSGVNVLVSRIRAGVLAYGADGDIRAAFGDHRIEVFDLHSIDMKRLRYESGERGLLREALSCAIARHRGLMVTRRRSSDLFAPEDPTAETWAPLRRLITPLSGTVEGFSDLTWREGVGSRLDWADDRLWMLIEPRIVFDGVTSDNRAAATDFTRERTVKRYNRLLNDLIAFWSVQIAGAGEEMRALGISDGVDAVFALSSDTAYSRRAGA
jgi:NAD-dependent SIR2 family protein deacetylase